jgi:hypothetical protein
MSPLMYGAQQWVVPAGTRYRALVALKKPMDRITHEQAIFGAA